MSSKTLEGMVRAYEAAFFSSTSDACTRAGAMQAALNWLADNVSDEMAKALVSCKDERGWKPSISAALRAAGDGR